VRELEEVANTLKHVEKTVPHVTFMDGSDSDPGRTMVADQRGAVRCRR
jgi:hypothetical protein